MARFLPGTNIEIVHDHLPRGPIRFALFDFDGTLSLIREGWQGIMIPMMVEVLHGFQPQESQTELTRFVTDYVTRSTGIQTIYQMIWLAQQVEQRGGAPLPPQEYKQEYLRRLWARIKDRVAAVKTGGRRPEEYMVPGARHILDALRARQVTCILASGTDRPYVVDEATALGLDGYFGPHIYGALEDYQSYSKRMVIARILADHGLSGPQLVTFGDGFVEIEDTVAVGGIAVGVASDETGHQGIDEWKRQRLIQAGAAIIVPDFQEYRALTDYLFAAPSEE